MLHTAVLHAVMGERTACSIERRRGRMASNDGRTAGSVALRRGTCCSVLCLPADRARAPAVGRDTLIPFLPRSMHSGSAYSQAHILCSRQQCKGGCKVDLGQFTENKMYRKLLNL